MKKIITLLFLLLAIVIAIIILNKLSYDWRPENRDNESRSTQSQIVPSTKEWKSEDLELLEKWAKQSEEQDPRSGNTIPFNATLADGETLITEVQELEPGVFHFTQLTPEQTPEGQILIRAQRLGVDLDGDTSMLSAPSIILEDGSAGTVSISSDRSFYEIQVTARRTEKGTILSGEVGAGPR